jgi:acyl-coenzyme A synthetase/AMP-(fatty) acid ligase
MGDVGYLDSHSRLWFCGRRAHRVVSSTYNKTFFSIPCEALFNVHPDVFRSALVAIPLSSGNDVIPAIIIEPEQKSKIDEKQLIKELQIIGKSNSLTKEINHYLIHPYFPVDIRHNAKIFREKLSLWAAMQLEGQI